MTYQKDIGKKGELIAASYLEKKGYEIIDMNYTTRYGELDLVALERDCVVFVEVKTRKFNTYGLPEDNVTVQKLSKIEKAALVWLQSHPESPDDWRVDVISIIIGSDGNAQDVQHFIQANL